jgi:hypothetical protein
VNTLLADSPAVSGSEQVPSPEQTPAQQTPGALPEGPPTPERTCANCGSPLNPGQDWCLQCGAGTPESLTTRGPSWRSAAAIIGLAAILAIGAATAAYAALSKSASKGRPVVTTVAQATVPPTATPVTPTAPVTPTTPPTSATPTTPGVTATTPVPGTPPAVNPLLPTGTTKPPKIPLTAPTPKSSGTPTTPTISEPNPPASTPKSSEGAPPSSEPRPTAILLDTNAASTYNPYGYPASSFGDPSLAIDGEATTGWTAQVEPAVAPKMAEGLTIDLKTPRRLSALALITSTPGMTVQVYGANGSALPTSITDPAWVQLSPYFLEKKKRVRIKLRHSAKAFRFVALWISNAPAASVGTPQAPGHVSINELELFPAKP